MRSQADHRVRKGQLGCTARRPAFARRGGAALREAAPSGIWFPPRSPRLASGQPTVNLNHPFLVPPDLPHEPLASCLVLGGVGLDSRWEVATWSGNSLRSR